MRFCTPRWLAPEKFPLAIKKPGLLRNPDTLADKGKRTIEEGGRPTQRERRLDRIKLLPRDTVRMCPSFCSAFVR